MSNPKKMPGSFVEFGHYSSQPLSVQSYAVARLVQAAKEPILWVVESEDLFETCKLFLQIMSKETEIPLSVLTLPSWWPSHYYEHHHISRHTEHTRMRALFELSQPSSVPTVILTTVHALSQSSVNLKCFSSLSFELTVSQKISREDLMLKVRALGFELDEICKQAGRFSVRGEVVDLFSATDNYPIRLHFFDDEIESISFFDPETQRKIKPSALQKTVLDPQSERSILSESSSFLKNLKEYTDDLGLSKAWRDKLFLEDQKSLVSFSNHLAFFLDNQHNSILDQLPTAMIVFQHIENALLQNKNCLLLLEKEYERFLNELQPQVSPHLFFSKLHLDPLKNAVFFGSHEKGVGLPSEKIQTRMELNSVDQFKKVRGPWDEEFYDLENRIYFLKQKTTEKRKRSHHDSWSGLDSLDHLQTGDFVVHRVHGVGKYLGTVSLETHGGKSDFLQILYANDHKLYVPMIHFSQIQVHRIPSTLDQLGGKTFSDAKNKAKDSIRKLAVDILKIQASRILSKSPSFEFEEEDLYSLEKTFPYPLTEDQKNSLADILEDFQNGILMDRLLCGDVGFGKTEVALRAAYAMTLSGYQTCLLVPTTLLCLQHEKTFTERLQSLGVRVESCSRLKSKKQQESILEDFKNGKVDILIGTHRILSKDVQPNKLGLLIIDEEHRFGVEHKELIKEKRVQTHVLSMTATPIPRTLSQSYSGIKSLSLLKTPPRLRQPVQTYLSEFSLSTIKRAVEHEISRGGQCFFVSPKIMYLHKLEDDLKKIFPELKIQTIHGQMSPSKMESVMVDFFKKKFDILLSTAIIESGIDLPSANTLFIHRADLFGLSQLHQIRGRVGRGKNKAFAYLFYHDFSTLSPEAKDRLETIHRFQDIGSGFEIAMKDLEIRGAGELVGAEQSGHMQKIGVDLFFELLQETVKELKGEKKDDLSSDFEPEIKIPYHCKILHDYIPEDRMRLSMYRRLSSSDSTDSRLKLKEEFEDRFGRLPPETVSLFSLVELKFLMKEYGFLSLSYSKKLENMVIQSQENNQKVDLSKLISWSSSEPSKIQLLPQSKLKINHVSFDQCQDLVDWLKNIFLPKIAYLKPH